MNDYQNQEDYEENEELEEGEDYENYDQGNNDKFKKFTEIATKKGDMVSKPVNNDHYDIAYEMNESVEEEAVTSSKKNQKADNKIGVHYGHNVDKLNYEEEEEEEEEEESKKIFLI